MSNSSDIGRSGAASGRADAVSLHAAQKLAAASGILGALIASSCCILSVVLFTLGISGAWIGNFTRLAPYQPDFRV